MAPSDAGQVGLTAGMALVLASVHFVAGQLRFLDVPEERESRFLPFALGAVAYAALLVTAG